MAADVARVWQSGDPASIAETLGDLLRAPFPREPITPPEPSVFDAFPEQVPTRVVMDYIAVLGNYRPLEPDLSPPEVVQRWVEAVLRTGNSSAALQVVLALRGDDPFPGAEVGDVLAYVAARGVRSPRARAGAEHLARHFLDHSQTYHRAVRALSSWTDDDVLADIVEGLAPYVRPEDRDTLRLSPG